VPVIAVLAVVCVDLASAQSHLITVVAESSAVPVYAGADITQRILEGTRSEDTPITVPQGSHVLFEMPTVWESHGWYIAGTIALVTAQLLLITTLLTQRQQRRRAEHVVRAREASLQTSYRRIRQLAGRLIGAQETARANLAQDLHDDICQRLAMVLTSIDRLKGSSADIQNPDTQQFLTAMARDTRHTFEAVRRLSHDLHPATLRVLGLAPGIRVHCSEVEQRHNVQVTFTAAGEFQDLPDEVAVCFFRIAQESLRNAVVHGAAHQLSVLLTNTGEHLDMMVTDDGRGFDLEAVTRDSSGIGIISMEERARVIGATLHIATSVGHGTTIRINVPLHPAPGVPVPDVTGPAKTMPAAIQSANRPEAIAAIPPRSIAGE